jgi:hypothetical protein
MVPMPADPIHPDQLGGSARFRADLVAYLDSLPVDQLADLLSEVPNRQQPLGLGVLMVALNDRLPDAYKLLPPAGQPGPGEGQRRSLRELVADRREPGATPAERDRDRQARSVTASPRTTSRQLACLSGARRAHPADLRLAGAAAAATRRALAAAGPLRRPGARPAAIPVVAMVG